MTNTTTEIIADLEERFERHPVWVWYDSHEKYANIIDDVEEAMEDRGVNVARYDGSFLDLKRRLWEDDNDVQEEWLFYIPLWQDRAGWFMDIHRLGRRYLPESDIGESPAAKYLVGKEDWIPDEYENWGQNREQLTRAFFCVLFGTHAHSPRDYVVEYLNKPEEYQGTIEEYNKAAEWGTILEENYGIDAGLDAEEIATQILFGELKHQSPTDRFDRLAAGDTRAATRLCSYWQRHDTPAFVDYALEVGQDRNIAGAILESDNLDWHSEAFRQVDDGLFQLVLNRLATADFGALPEEAENVLEFVERRQDGFWYDESFVGYWDILGHGLEVVRSAGNAIKNLEAEDYSTSELASEYTDAWWEIDAEYRRYVRSAMEFRQYVEDLSEVRDRITNYYTRFVKALNRPLADSFADDPHIGTPQTDFFDKHLSSDEGTAVIICDGLRYELAKELEAKIQDGEDIDLSLSLMSAGLPSITEVGMATHLPGQLAISLERNDLRVTIDGDEMKTKSDRVEKLESSGFTVSDLSDVLETRMSELKADGQPPRVVYSGIIDKLGENLDDDNALVKTAEHIRDVDDVIQRLRTAGYTRFIVTADHGFLYTERLPDELKIEALDGSKVTKRRFALAEADDPVQSGDEVIEFGLDQFESLGIDAQDLRAFFPRSVACFKAAGGNMRYFHGGISMQELAVPCLTLTTEVVEEEAPVEYEVTFPGSITNTIIDVEVSARSSQISFDNPPALRLTATVDGREVAEPKVVEIKQGGNQETLRLKSGELDEDDTVIFEAIEEDTRETVTRKEAQVDMLIREDFGFDV